MSLRPTFQIDPSNQTDVREIWRKACDDINPDVVARCEQPELAARVCDGLNLMAIAEPESWWDTDDFCPWNERSVGLMHKLMKDFLPAMKQAADAYIAVTKQEGDWFEGVTEINSDSFTVRYCVRGCGRGCCPDYGAWYDIPLRFIWDRENVIKEMNEAKEQQEAERKRKEAEEAKKKAEEAQIAKEARDRAEFERLKAKYDATGGAK